MTWTVEEGLPPGFSERLKSLDASKASPAAYQAAFNDLLTKLKHTPRTGWVDRGLADPESIADHMWRMSVMCWESHDSAENKVKRIQIALVHDVAEAIVGDLTPYCGISVEEKHDRERQAMEYLSQLASKFNPQFADEILECWNDYERAQTPDALFVKDIDKLELYDQSRSYGRTYRQDMSSFDGVKSKIKSSEVKEWANGVDEWDSVAP